MNIFNIPYDEMILIDEFKANKQRIYFQKTRFTEANVDQYFIKIYKVEANGKNMCQGYIYFYLDFLKKESNFIGIYVCPKYRAEGLAQLLISYWTTLCLDNGIYNLNTTRRQRKPFILYLLKKFKFDLLNIERYETSGDTISICKAEGSTDKLLFFKNSYQAQTFRHGNINRGDNYLILDSLTEDIEVLDQVLLSNPYMSKNDNDAYTRSLRRIDAFKKN